MRSFCLAAQDDVKCIPFYTCAVTCVSVHPDNARKTSKIVFAFAKLAQQGHHELPMVGHGKLPWPKFHGSR